MLNRSSPLTKKIHHAELRYASAVRQFHREKQSDKVRKLRAEASRQRAPKTTEEWIHKLFPAYVSAPLGKHHQDFWDWVDLVRPGISLPAFIALWARGGAKSTSAELATVYVGAQSYKEYGLYISGTQEQADNHVSTISSMLESPEMSEFYPDMARRRLGKYGQSKGWRRQRLRTASGFTIDALGLDSASRGAKVENIRPDWIVFDDIDSKHDSPKVVNKKKDIITSTILPIGSVKGDTSVIFVQNLIHEKSIASMLANGTADFLLSRIMSGPIPAVYDLEYHREDSETGGLFIVDGGSPSWEGQNLSIVQSQMNLWGLQPFLEESQHEVLRKGGIWDDIEFMVKPLTAMPQLISGCVWCDPAISSTDQSDNNGIQADGIDSFGKIWRLYSWEGIDNPESVLRRSILKALELGLPVVGVETDQGGDTWQSVFYRVWEQLFAEGLIPRSAVIALDGEVLRLPLFAAAKAGSIGSKTTRNQMMIPDYQHGRIVHTEGTNSVLERSLLRFPNKPLDLADAAFWSWNHLRNPDSVTYYRNVYDPVPIGLSSSLSGLAG